MDKLADMRSLVETGRANPKDKTLRTAPHVLYRNPDGSVPKEKRVHFTMLVQYIISSTFTDWKYDPTVSFEKAIASKTTSWERWGVFCKYCYQASITGTKHNWEFPDKDFPDIKEWWDVIADNAPGLYLPRYKQAFIGKTEIDFKNEDLSKCLELYMTWKKAGNETGVTLLADCLFASQVVRACALRCENPFWTANGFILSLWNLKEPIEQLNGKWIVNDMSHQKDQSNWLFFLERAHIGISQFFHYYQNLPAFAAKTYPATIFLPLLRCFQSSDPWGLLSKLDKNPGCQLGEHEVIEILKLPAEFVKRLQTTTNGWANRMEALETINRKLSRKSRELDKLNTNLYQELAQCSTSKLKISQLEAENQSLRDQIGFLSEDTGNLKEKLKDARAECNRLALVDNQRLQQAYRIRALEDKLQVEMSKIGKLTPDTSTEKRLAEEVVALKLENEAAKKAAEVQDEQISTLQTQWQTMKDEKDKLLKEIPELRKRVQDMGKSKGQTFQSGYQAGIAAEKIRTEAERQKFRDEMIDKWGVRVSNLQKEVEKLKLENAEARFAGPASRSDGRLIALVEAVQSAISHNNLAGEDGKKIRQLVDSFGKGLMQKREHVKEFIQSHPTDLRSTQSTTSFASFTGDDIVEDEIQKMETEKSMMRGDDEDLFQEEMRRMDKGFPVINPWSTIKKKDINKGYPIPKPFFIKR